MRKILLGLTIFSTIFVSGCGNANFQRPVLEVQDGAVMKEGLNPKLEIAEGAFKEPILKVEKEAVKLVIESGAINVHEGAINLNLIGKKKAPFIDTKALKEALGNLKKLEGLEGIPDDLKDKVLSNEEVYQAVIKALLEMIDKHNEQYAEQPKDE